MADREKVIKAIICRRSAHKRCGNPCERTGACAYAAWIRDPDGEPYYPCYCDVERLCDDALALLREQEPRVMTMSEVKRIGADNHGSFKNDGLTVMWLEEFGKQYPLHVVVLKWDEDDWSGGPNDIVDVYYFGTDEYDRFGLTDYNLTWRCWTDKPTETQRMGAAWDA